MNTEKNEGGEKAGEDRGGDNTFIRLASASVKLRTLPVWDLFICTLVLL